MHTLLLPMHFVRPSRLWWQPFSSHIRFNEKAQFPFSFQSIKTDRFWRSLFSCKYCAWAVVFDVAKSVDKVFRCGNAHCEAVFCRECGLDWDEDHFGVPCHEMEADRAAKTCRQ